MAEAHARLGLRRPQGRALVQVREPGHAHLDPVTPPSLVVDIVTDDMPYLVDSVTTRLNRHQADIGLIVHPVLRVRRDVTGALREIVGVCADDVPAATDELTESWIHVEMEPPGDRVTAGQLEEDLRHVLDDVRVAVEDRTRMEAVARRLADDLGGEAGRSARGDDPAGLAASGDGPKPPARTWPSSVSCCAGWPTATSPSSATANTTWCGPGKAPACAPCRGPGSASSATPGRAGTCCASCPHRWRPGRRTPANGWSWPRRTPGPPSTAPTTWTTSRSRGWPGAGRGAGPPAGGVWGDRPENTVTGEFRFLGLYSHTAHTAPIASVPVIRRKLAHVLAEAGLSPSSHDGKDLAEILEDYPREELFEISADELTPIALGVLRLSERKQTRLFLRRDRYGRYMSCLVYLPRERYTTKVRLRAQEILSEALNGASVDYSATVGDSALARLHVVVRAERGQVVPQVDAAALERRLAAAVRSWDEDLSAEAIRVLGEERARTLLDLCRGEHPRDLQGGRLGAGRGRRPDHDARAA